MVFMPKISMILPFLSISSTEVYKNNVTANIHITTAITPSNICQARGRSNTGIKNRAPKPKLQNHITEASIAPSAK